MTRRVFSETHHSWTKKKSGSCRCICRKSHVGQRILQWRHCWECNVGNRIAIDIRQKVVLSINGNRLLSGRVRCCYSLPYSTCIFIHGNSICILVVLRYCMYMGHSWLESALASWDLQYGYIMYYPSGRFPTHPFRVLGLVALGNTKGELILCKYHGRTAWWCELMWCLLW